jgi:hypothetical protein
MYREVQLLFGAIEEDGSLLQISKDRPQAYRITWIKLIVLEKDIKGISDDFERLKTINQNRLAHR